MSHWGWHRVPPAAASPPVELESYEFLEVNVSGHAAQYATNCTPTPAYNYLRENPHRINLARVFLRRLAPTTTKAGENDERSEPEPIAEGDISAIDQTLHLWNGSLASAFTLDSQPVTVTTAVHPSQDALAIRLCSPLVARKRLGIGIAFPYATTTFAGGTDWALPERHSSAIVATAGGSTALNHTLDNTTYFVLPNLAAPIVAGGERAAAEPTLSAGSVPHDFIIAPSGGDCLHATLQFQRQLEGMPAPPSVEDVFAASAAEWADAWRSGAALDLSGSTAVGAAELERRVVLSQYIMMSQEAGSNPPQETGLMTNSWYGKCESTHDTPSAFSAPVSIALTDDTRPCCLQFTSRCAGITPSTSCSGAVPTSPSVPTATSTPCASRRASSPSNGRGTAACDGCVPRPAVTLRPPDYQLLLTIRAGIDLLSPRWWGRRSI